MSIIEKVFKYGETELSVIKCKDDMALRGKTPAEVLGYSNPLKAIRMHIDSEDKKEMSELVYKRGCPKWAPLQECTARDHLHQRIRTLFLSTSLTARICICFKVMGNQRCITIH